MLFFLMSSKIGVNKDFPPRSGFEARVISAGRDSAEPGPDPAGANERLKQ